MALIECPKEGCENWFEPVKKNGWTPKFCSISCANSRQFSDKTKALKSRKNKEWWASLSEDKQLRFIKKEPPYTKIVWCKVCGMAKAKKSPKHESIWCNLRKIRTTRLLANTFDVILGTMKTIRQLDEMTEKLSYIYHIERKSGREIKEMFGFQCSVSHISNLMKTIGIDRRGFSDAVKIAVENGFCNPGVTYPYKNGWHVDWLGNTHFYRSSYELTFYLELDQKKVKYSTESLRIRYYDSSKCDERIAIPDVIVGDRIYEIKSEYTYDAINMKDKFREYIKNGYKLTLVLGGENHEIDHEDDLPKQKLERTIYTL